MLGRSMLLQKVTLVAQQQPVDLPLQLTWQLSAQQEHRSGIADHSHCPGTG